MSQTEIIRKFVSSWIESHEPSTFIKDETGRYMYTSSDGVVSINLEAYFQQIIEDYIDTPEMINQSREGEIMDFIDSYISINEAPKINLPISQTKFLKNAMCRYLINFSAAYSTKFHPDKFFIELEQERLVWSLKTFPEATKESSLQKLKEEVKEIEDDLAAGKPNPEEYADALMCLLDSAGRAGIFLPQILNSFSEKLKINKSRTWIQNPDNTYSHLKNIENGK